MTSAATTYCGLMEDIKKRVALVRRFTRGQVSLGRDDFDAETLCIQIRKILESIAFGSLVAHQATYEAAHADIETRWRAKQILDRMEAVHPKFYPEPMTPNLTDGKGRMEPFAGNFLTRDDFVTLYDLCGSALHMWNPFRPGPRVIDFGRSLDQWCDLIQALLHHHVIWMYAEIEPGDGWFVQMDHPDDHKVHAFLFAPVSSDETETGDITASSE
ncbi:MAG: hypothetical protein JNL81_07750 [Hyphomonadaceae bacterium]|nr:hypothetical protein [Hyphomonadaceae bacterium]